MKRHILSISLSILFFLSSSVYAEVDFGFQPRAEIGAMNYRVDLESSASIFNTSYSFSDTLPYATIGSSFFLNRFYLDLKFQQSAKGTDQYTNTAFLHDATSTSVKMDGSVTFKRREFSTAFGYAFKGNISIFAGYRRSYTDFTQKGFAEINLIDDGSITGTSGTPVTIQEIGDIDFDFDTKGPFLGASYGYVVEEKGVLSFNLGVAFLDADFSQSGDFVNAQTGGASALGGYQLKTSGDTVGISYSIGWKGILTSRLGYFLSFGGYQYDFESDKDNRSDITEVMYYGSIGFSYAF